MHNLKRMGVVNSMAVVLLFIIVIQMYQRRVKKRIVQLPTGYKPEYDMKPYYSSGRCHFLFPVVAVKQIFTPT